jgi:hypothetical protein
VGANEKKPFCTSDGTSQISIGNWPSACFASTMIRERHYEEPNGTKTTILPAILKPKFALANNCIVPP